MYDRKVVRRRRAVLAACVGLSIVLLTAYFGGSAGGVAGALQRGTQKVFAPLESGASRALKPVRDLAGWTEDLFDAKGDNEELRDEVARLRTDLARAQTDARDAEQLRGLVGLAETEGFPSEIRRVSARVIAHSPTVWYSAIQIDQGSDDGVAVDQPVITGDGLVGKVTEVTGGTARVTLITDDSSGVSAQIMPAGVAGVVEPRVGDPDDLLLNFIEKGRRPRKGDVVVTSGSTSTELESPFPRGLPIGKVRRSEPGELDLYQRVHLEPFADLRRMDFVQVLATDPPEEIAGVDAP